VVDGAGLLLVGGSVVVDDGVGVAVVVAVGAALAVVVLGLADVDAVEDAVELAVAVVAVVVAVAAEGEGSVLTVGDFEVLAVEVAVLEVAVLEVLAVGSLVDGCGLGELLVAVGVGVAVGEEVDCGSGWHCCTAPVDVASAAASSTG